MKKLTYLLLLVFIVIIGCNSNKLQEIDTLNAMYPQFWTNGEYKEVLDQWLGHSIYDMFQHDDFDDCRYQKVPLSPHLDFYVIELSVWQYANQAVNSTNNFTIHVFTNKNNQVLSITYPKPTIK